MVMCYTNACGLLQDLPIVDTKMIVKPENMGIE